MAAVRRSRAWWAKTVAAWRRSGLTGGEYASREGLTERTLRWWASALGRGTRAEHAYPIELALPTQTVEASGPMIELVVDGVTVRVAPSVDDARIARIVRALREPRS